MTLIKKIMNRLKQGIQDLEKNNHNRLCSTDCDGCARLKLYYELLDEFKGFAKENLDEIKYNLMGLAKKKLEVRKNRELLKFVEDLQEMVK